MTFHPTPPSSPQGRPHPAMASSGTPAPPHSLTHGQSARGWGWLAVSALCPPCLITALPDAFRHHTSAWSRRAWSPSLTPSAHSWDPGLPQHNIHPPLQPVGVGIPRWKGRSWESQLFPGKPEPPALDGYSRGGPGRRWATLPLLPRAHRLSGPGQGPNASGQLCGDRGRRGVGVGPARTFPNEPPRSGLLRVSEDATAARRVLLQ